jgi:hypothetical protein
MALVKLVGNFIEIADKTLPTAQTFYEAMDLETYLSSLKLDTDRTCYVSYQYSVDDIKNRLHSTDQLMDKVSSYSQGQITGALFTQISTLEKRYRLMSCGDATLVNRLTNEFCLTYIDKDGNICGLSVVYMVPYYDVTLHNNTRSFSFPTQFSSGHYPFSLCVVKKPVNTPSEINVTYYVHPDMLCLNTLLKLSQHPQTLPFDEIRLLLKNQNGCILYDDDLYYVDIIEKTFLLVDPSPEKELLIATIDVLEMNQSRVASSEEDRLIGSVIQKPNTPLKQVDFVPQKDMVNGITEEEFRVLINNDELSQVLSGMISGDTLNISHFKAFAARIAANHNIDDRDLRQKNIQEMMNVFQDTFPKWSGLKEYIEDIRREAEKDIHFYRLDVFIKKINEMVDKARQLSGALEDSYIQRLILTQEAILCELQLFENPEMEDASKRRLQNTAIMYRELLKSMHNFEVILGLKNTSNSKDIQKKLYLKGDDILNLVKSVSLSDFKVLPHEDLLKVTEVLNCCSDVLVHPTQKSHIEKLNQLSKEVVGKENPFLKKLGYALMVFAGLVLVVAGVIGFLPSGGSSLLVTALGGGALTAGLTGFGLYRCGQEKGIAKSVSELKDELIMIQNDENVSTENTPPPRPPSRESSGSIDSIESDSPTGQPKI